MDSSITPQSRMKEDELVSRIRYHEDRLRAIEHEAGFHRTAADQARAELDALRKAPQPRPHLTAA